MKPEAILQNGQMVDRINPNLSPLARYTIVFLILLPILLLYYIPVLRYPFSMDPIHLIRPYSLSELTGSWGGHWDPDNIETVGWRPLTPVFFSIQWLIFRSSFFAHRCGLIVLQAVMLVLFYRLFERISRRGDISLAAVLISATAVFNYYHVTFLSDGIHLFLACLLLVATELFLQAWADPHPLRLASFYLIFVLALLIREEAVSWALALPFIGVLCREKQPLRRLWPMGGLLLVVIAVYFALRTLILRGVDYPAGVLLHPQGCSDRYPDLVRGLRGVITFFDIGGAVTAQVLAGAIIIAALIFSPARLRYHLLLLAAVVILTVLHTAVYYRSNLLYCSIPFAALLFVLSIRRLIPIPSGRWVIVSIFCLLGIMSAYRREITFHPRAVTSLAWDLDLQKALMDGAGADPVVAGKLEDRLSAFGLLLPDGRPDRGVFRKLENEAAGRPAVSWPWKIPPKGAFVPAEDTWW
jgi:hypothetical protein